MKQSLNRETNAFQKQFQKERHPGCYSSEQKAKQSD